MRRPTRFDAPRVLLWLAALGALAFQWGHARYFAFAEADRPDGNSGHAQIDFGGQWVIGRLLATGHGPDLYRRGAQREAVEAAYDPDDATKLMGWFMGADDPADPRGGVGGPLYPPVQALLMAPLAASGDPRAAYRLAQTLLALLAPVAGLGLWAVTRGRIWWSAGTLLVVAFPGFRAGVQLAQNPAVTLCVVLWGWAALRAGRPLLGGAVWGILAFKPVWAAALLPMAVLVGGRRFALAMGAGGAGLCLLTLPWVGVGAWRDWLTVGGLASDLYAVDANWIAMSRDLFGLPRRLLLDFEAPRETRHHAGAGALGWAAWAAVFALTLRATWHGRGATAGRVPALAALGAWLTCYHFMYYDALLSLFGFALLIAEPGASGVRRGYRLARDGSTSFTRVDVASLPLTLMGLMCLHGLVLAGLHLGLTANAGAWTFAHTLPDGATECRTPVVVLSGSYGTPVETFAALVVWGWLLRGGRPGERRGVSPTSLQRR